jgi:DNA-binding transcriptional LysR family regulator
MTEAVAQASAAAKQTSGTRINTLGMAARQVIAPRLGRHRSHPDVTLDIVDDELKDIVAGRFDADPRGGGWRG